MTDTTGMETPYVLNDKGLEEIRQRVTGTCGCCGENVHDFDTADVLELLDDVDRLRSDAYAEAVEKYAADMADQARIRSMEIRGGTFSLSLEDAREMTAAYVATARTMLGDAENYSETRVDFPTEKVELELKLAGESDRYVFTVQRAGKLTPHEARVKAEAERDDAREVAELCRQAINQMPISVYEFLGVEAEELPDWFTGYDNGRELWLGGDDA